MKNIECKKIFVMFTLIILLTVVFSPITNSLKVKTIEKKIDEIETDNTLENGGGLFWYEKVYVTTNLYYLDLANVETFSTDIKNRLGWVKDSAVILYDIAKDVERLIDEEFDFAKRINVRASLLTCNWLVEDAYNWINLAYVGICLEFLFSNVIEDGLLAAIFYYDMLKEAEIEGGNALQIVQDIGKKFMDLTKKLDDDMFYGPITINAKITNAKKGELVTVRCRNNEYSKIAQSSTVTISFEIVVLLSLKPYGRHDCQLTIYGDEHRKKAKSDKDNSYCFCKGTLKWEGKIPGQVSRDKNSNDDRLVNKNKDLFEEKLFKNFLSEIFPSFKIFNTVKKSFR